TRHVQRWRVQDVAGRHPVHIGDLAAAAPLQPGGGDPWLLLQRRVARGLRRAMARRVQFPEDAPAALVRQVVEIIQGDVGETTRHLAPLRLDWSVAVGSPFCGKLRRPTAALRRTDPAANPGYSRPGPLQTVP